MSRLRNLDFVMKRKGNYIIHYSCFLKDDSGGRRGLLGDRVKLVIGLVKELQLKLDKDLN